MDLARHEPAILQDAEERRATINLNSRETREHYSGAQNKTYAYKVLHGTIDLPEGPGLAWPLLLAGQWLAAHCERYPLPTKTLWRYAG